MSTTTRITDVLVVGVPVSDQDKALTFYTETLGFETKMDAEIGPGMRWVEVEPPGSTTAIALIAAGPEFRPASTRESASSPTMRPPITRS